MSVTPNVNELQAQLADLQRRIKALETGTPLSNSSVTDGRLRMIGDSSLEVTGSADVSGTLNVSGTENVSGDLNVSGPLDVTGNTSIGGSTDITGALTTHDDVTLGGATKITGDATITGKADISGDTTLSGDVDITGATTLTGNLTQTSGSVDFKSNVKIEGNTEIDGDTTLKGNLSVQDDGIIEVKAGGQFKVDATNPLILSADNANALSWQSGAYLISNDAGVGMGAGGHGAAFQADADGTASAFYASGQVAIWTSPNGVTLYSPDGTKSVTLSNSGFWYIADGTTRSLVPS